MTIDLKLYRWRTVVKTLTAILFTLFLCLTSISQSFAGINDGLVAYYPFNGDAKDESGNANDGAVYGASLTEDRFGNAGKAFGFDGESDYITIPDNTMLRLSNTDFTISTWIYETDRNASYVDAILAKRESGNAVGWIWGVRGNLATDEGAVHYQVSGGTDPSTNSNQKISLNSWNHVLLVYNFNDRTAKIYINSELDKTVSEIPTPNSLTQAALFIGKNSSSETYHFHGIIDDVRIYSRILSEEEISYLYNIDRINLSIPQSATEGDGILPNQGSVSVFPAPESDLTVYLASDDTAKVAVPDSVTIVAGTNSASFDIVIGEDSLVDGQQSVEVQATAEHYLLGTGSINVHDSIDYDNDGINNDGDNSGIVGDNPCIGGQTENCDDNCPTVYNPDQRDVDGNGIGDLCEPTMVLDLYQEIPTSGAFDFEGFTINEEHYLAVANYYNGSSFNIASVIYKWNGSEFLKIQDINTNGARDWESFKINGETYLIVANRYNGSSYNVNSVLYKWDGSSFIQVQSIPTSSAMEWKSFTIDGETYLAVANQRNNSTYSVASKIYKWNQSEFEEIQSIMTEGACQWEAFTIDDESYLAVGNVRNDSTWYVDSKIYKWDGSQFIEIQAIPTTGGYCWEHFTIDGQIYLALANTNNGTTRNLESKIYQWNGTQFAEMQSIATNGGVDWESFEISGQTYLALANIYNDSSYNTHSSIYKWNGHSFKRVQNFFTNGASDWEYFSIDNQIYIVVSNYRNDVAYNLNSKIFRVTSKSLSDGLIAYYPFDGSFEDKSGNALHLTGNGDISVGTDRFDTSGHACYFDGVDDYLSIASDPLLNPQDQLTISLWIKRDSFLNTWTPIIHKGGAVTSNYSNREYAVWLNSSSYLLLTSAGDDSGQHSLNSSTAQVDEWTFYTAVIDRKNNQTCIFLNGQLDQIVSDSYSSFNTNDDELRIGWTEETASTYSRFFGTLDDIRIYNRALTEEEISHLYNANSIISITVPEIVTEGDGSLSQQGLVTISPAPYIDVEVFLTSDDTSEISLPHSVVIPAGNTTASFDIIVEDDADFDFSQTLSLKATAEYYRPGSAYIQVDDNETLLSKDNSPYQITEDAHVKNLTIEPGVRIEFLGDYSFEVSGTLTAIGTEQEPIVFTASESNTDGWQGIHFNENIPGSELAYCTIEKANNSGIRIINSLPIIRDCTITNNQGVQGGGLNIDLSSLSGDDELTITNCIVSDNTSSSHGGGIKANLGSATLSFENCTISDNISNPSKSNGSIVGGAIYSVTDDGRLNLTDCLIDANTCYSRCYWDSCSVTGRGGGIFSNGNLDIERSVVTGNMVHTVEGGAGGDEYVYSYGGGIYLYAGELNATNCLIHSNTTHAHGARAYSYGGGLYINGGAANVVNCTISRNLSYEPYYGASWGRYYAGGGGIRKAGGTLSLLNSIVYYNQISINGTDSYSQISGSATASYSDIQDGFEGEGNILGAPQFAGENDFHLLSNSPCIDTATAEGAPDHDIEYVSRPQGDGYDMGAYATISNDTPIGTTVCSFISEDTVWDLNGNPYTVICDTTILPDITLTIEPGVIVRFTNDARLNVQGTLDAQGTSANPITFTSSTSEPAAEDWYGIIFGSNSIGNLSHAIIEYAQYGIRVTGNGTQTLTDCIIRYNKQGVRVEASGGNPVIHRSSLYGNTAYNCVLTTDTSLNLTVDMRDNWWGTEDPVAISETIADYFYSTDRGVVDYTGFLDGPDGNEVPGNYLIGATDGDVTLPSASYIVPNSYYIRSGHTLTISTGTTLSFASGQLLRVDGALIAEGTDAEKITFTSSADVPAPEDWYGIIFRSNSTGTLSHVVIEYAQYGIRVTGNGTQTLTDCIIRYNMQGVRVEASGGNPIIHRSSLYGNTAYNCVLTTDTSSNLTVDMRDNWWGTEDPVAISETIADYFYSTDRGVVDYTGFLDGPDGSAVPGNYLIGATDGDVALPSASYIVPNSYYIRSGHTLTISTGTTLSFASGQLLRVDGALIAEGTNTEKITFTSLADMPAPEDWYGIIFRSNSTGTLSHVVIEYAQYGIRVTGSGNQTITDCTIRYNTQGVRVEASGGNPIINESSIYENTQYNYMATSGTSSSLTLDAQDNWWGTQDELEISELIWDSNDNSNCATVNYDPWQFEMPDTEGPVVSNIRFNNIEIQSGVTLTESGTLTLSAIDDLSGMQSVKFYVNGELKHIDYNNTGNYSFDWDIADINDGSYDIAIRAFDNHPDANMTEVLLENIQVAMASPESPVFTESYQGLVVGWNTLNLSGTAEPDSTITVYNNGEIVASNIYTNTDGQFQVTIGLNEGENSIQISATNRGGESELSTSMVVNMSPSALTAPTGFSADAKAAGLIRLSWSNSGVASIKGYDIYRSEVEFSTTAEAEKLNTNVITGTSYQDLPTTDGTYYYRVLAMDPADNESELSNQVSAESDSEPPRAVSIQYTPTSSPHDPDTGRMGPGLVQIDLTVSEPLMTTPFLGIVPEGGMSQSIELTQSSELTYTGYLTISDATLSGTAYANVSCRDAVGNRGTEIDSGSTLKIDTDGPAVTDLAIQPQTPIQNDADNPVSITVTIGLNEEIPDGQTPVLSYLLSGTGRSITAIDGISEIAVQDGHVQTWEAVFTLPADAGLSEAESLEFIYQSVDDLGNANDSILCDNLFQVYQGDLPPLEPPDGLTGQALPGGEIHLSWNAVENADGYVLYRMAPDEIELTELVRFDTELEYTDQTPSDGLYTYAVASIRQENSQEAISGMSAQVQVLSDSVPPQPPLNLALTLISTGIQATWEANPATTEPVTYALYRDDVSPITNLEEARLVKENVSGTTVIDAYPSQAERNYAVTAVDAVGNASLPSNTAYLNVDLLPVSSLTVIQVDDALPAVSWTHSGTNMNYDIYLGPDGSLEKLNQELMSEPSYTDTGYSGDERRYTVLAVDSEGHESLGRSITLPKLNAVLADDEEIRRGIMNRLDITVENSSPNSVENARLILEVESYTHTSETFSIAPGATQVVPVIVGGYADLPDLAAITLTIEVTPNEGEKVEITRTSEIDVFDGMMVLGIENGELLRGTTTGSVSFTLENTGEEEIEILTAKNSGGTASNEVTLLLLDEDGNVLSSANLRQNLGQDIVTLSDGRSVARIAAGSVFTSAPVDITIPANAPDEVILKLVITRVYYHLGKTAQVTMNGLATTQDISLADTSYYGEVISISPETSGGDEDIIISGQAVDRSTGSPLGGVPLNLIITLNGFERTYSVYTDAQGTFEYAFRPGTNESGVYKVRAMHPERIDKPVHGTFTVTRVSVSPTRVNLNISKNYEQAISITVKTGSATQVNNLELIYDAADQPNGAFPEGVHVTLGDGVSLLDANRRATLPCTVWADNTADQSGTLVLRVKSDESGDEGWGTVTINTCFSQAKPVLRFTPNYVETGLVQGDTVTETITLKNTGLAAMNNVALSLVKTDGTAAPDWISLTTGNTLGDIDQGESMEVGVTFSPSTDLSVGDYQYKLRIQSDNTATTDINLFVAVADDDPEVVIIGNALFKVSDIYTGTLDDNGNVIQGLRSARILVQNESDTTIEQTLSTDSYGEALFSNLPIGTYKCRVTASNHQQYTGRLWIKPDVTVTHEAFLSYNLVSVEWEVNEITIEDRYEIKLNATYETNVPAPVVVAKPASFSLPDMASGDVYNGEFTLSNYGLIQAEQLNFQLPKDDEYFAYELLDTLPDTLGAKERITVSFRVTCLKSFTPDGDDSGGGCRSYKKCGKFFYGYECINGHWEEDWRNVCWTRVVCSSSSTGGSSYSPDETFVYISGGTDGVGTTSGRPNSSSTSASPDEIEGQICLPIPDRDPEDSDPCENDESRTEDGSIIHLLYREFQLNPTDMIVKVPGGTIFIDRWYYENEWHLEHARYNLSFERDLLDDSIESIDMAGAIYGAKLSGNETIYVNGTYRIVEIEGGYRWETKRGIWREFDENGRMTSYGNRRGAIEQLLYEEGEDGRVIGLTDRNDNQVIWFEYTDDTITVTDVDGRWVEYAYTDDLLAGVKRSINHVAGTFVEESYAYDAKGRIITITDANGNEKHITYDAYGNVDSDVDQDGVGKFFEFGYDKSKDQYYALVRTSAGLIKEKWFDENGETVRVDINGRTIEKTVIDGRNRIITDENGNITTKTYDEWDNLIQVIHPDESIVTYEYEHTYHRRIKETNELGVVTRYEYDSVGNLTRKTEASGTTDERITEFTYDAEGNMLTTTVLGDANTDAATMVMIYDASGNMISRTDPEGNVTQFTSHDALGNVLTKIDARGKLWAYEYDKLGHMIKMTDPLDHETSYEYDGNGNKTKETDAEGKITQYRYDTKNNLVRIIDAAGNESSYAYDTDNNRIREVDQEGKEVNYEYDNEGRLTKTIDGNGNETTVEYAETTLKGCSSCSSGGVYQNYPSKIIYPTFTKRFEYDLRGRKTTEYDVLSDTDEYIARFEYDLAGNLTIQIDRESNATQYKYDALNRKVKAIDTLGGETVYTYDDRDNLIALQDANGNITRFEYDRNNRKIKEIRPMGEETVYEYNALGNLTAKIDAKNQKTEYVYDDAGRRVSALYYAEGDHTTPVKTVTFNYDNVGNLLGYDDGTTSAQYEYDDLYRKTSETVDYGNFSKGYSYTYYKNSMKKSFTGPDGVTYEYGYYDNKQLAEVGIPDIWSINYNSYNWTRPTSITLPGGTQKQYTYDSLMQVKSITVKDPGQSILMEYHYTYDKTNHITDKSTEHGYYSFGYDNLYRLTVTNNPDFDDEEFMYDKMGNRLTSSDTAENWSYNDNNELCSYDTSSFFYDDNGNMVQKTVDGVVVNFVYSPEDRLIGIRDGSNQVIASYFYDPFGRRLWKEVKGVRTYFHYSDEGLIGEYDENGIEIKTIGYKPNSTWTTDPLFMKVGSEYYFYQNDHLGTPQKMTDTNGTVIWSAKYNSFGRTTIEAETITNNVRYPGQYHDNEKELIYNWHRFYDPIRGRYIRTDPIGFKGGNNQYTYAYNNPITKYDFSGLVVYADCYYVSGGEFLGGGGLVCNLSEVCKGHTKQTATYIGGVGGVTFSVLPLGGTEFSATFESADDVRDLMGWGTIITASIASLNKGVSAGTLCLNGNCSLDYIDFNVGGIDWSTDIFLGYGVVINRSIWQCCE